MRLHAKDELSIVLRISCIFVLSLLLAGSCVGPAGAWGVKGHQIVGFLAELKMKHATLDKVHAILGNESLGTAATWADEVRALQKAKSDAVHDHRPVPMGTAEQEAFLNDTQNASNGNWHFVNLPLDVNKYSTDFNHGKIDIVDAATECVKVLRGQSTRFTKKIALRLLVHYLGDMHQPLHVGVMYLKPLDDGSAEFVRDPQEVIDNEYKSDIGGNILYYSKTQQLHHLWDTPMVESLMHGSDSKVYASNLATVTEPAGWKPQGNDVAAWYKAWAYQSVTVSRSVYKGVTITGVHMTAPSHGTPEKDGYAISLGDTPQTPVAQRYATRHQPEVKTQLLRAGLRLAFVLDKVLP